MPPEMTYRQAARKAVAMCVSDFAAKGVRPTAFMASLGLERGVTASRVSELRAGFEDAELEWGAKLVGGDTNEASELVIDCAMLGFAGRVVGRSGAEPGDLVVVGGRFGHPPCGLAILMTGARAREPFRSAAVSSVLRPDPHLAEGLAVSRYLTSAMDSSDGLARSLHELADASGVGIEVDRLPVEEGVLGFALDNGLSPEDLVFSGGEEYVVVGTLRRGKLAAAEKAAALVGGTLTAIGKVAGRKGSVTWVGKGGSHPIGDTGWTHLG